ncbi:MAG: hypothetical protein M3Y89_18615 [Actinomycetota bacterium]|nr:hypothetical protein [Actinomycetota bacterium]
MLSGPMRTQGSDHPVAESEGAGSCRRLRLVEPEPATYPPRAVGAALGWVGHPVRVEVGAGGGLLAAVLPYGTVDGSTHEERAPVEVDVIPHEPECLALAESEGQCDRPAGAVADPGCRFQDRSRFVTGERLEVGLDKTPRLGQRRRVESDDPAPDGQAEGGTKTP